MSRRTARTAAADVKELLALVGVHVRVGKPVKPIADDRKGLAAALPTAGR